MGKPLNPVIHVISKKSYDTITVDYFGKPTRYWIYLQLRRNPNLPMDLKIAMQRPVSLLQPVGPTTIP